MTQEDNHIYEGQISDFFALDNCVALVAGGYGGIGAALSLGLAQQGAKIAVAGRSETKAVQFAQMLNAKNHDSFGVAFDVKDPDDIARMTNTVVEQYGKIDVLVNCVGTQIEKPAEDYAVEDWDHVHDTNLRGAFFLAQAVGRQMIKQGGGKQIHLSSVRSLLGIRRGYIGYTTSKAGLNLMVKQLATEWAKYRINVNGIAPTFIRTELVRQYLEDRSFYESLVNRIPLGRVGEPQDIVGLTILLSSRAADFITGQVIFIDGGVTATQ